ncbi:hypothetical protein ACEVT5_004462 [Salmonella enterica]|uniref:hypothetical protein n=1 Tax=Klebsiella pneumoniae TaxID=573 RepID=UPI0013EEEA4E|nr:hypothetical protein [Klebsiella pneumoniae]EET1434498.1 hypothetical protein [Escherichia coli]EFM5365771.1 hypothetical protein [Escherichia coli]EGH5610418.1 hypothetical protein [Escherichia coli]EHK1011385.1 hypothetical protein [Escherichia coli]
MFKMIVIFAIYAVICGISITASDFDRLTIYGCCAGWFLLTVGVAISVFRQK